MTKTAFRGLRFSFFLLGTFLMQAVFPVLTQALTLSLPEQAPEDSPVLSSRGKITIPQPLDLDLAVHLSCSDASRAAVPEKVVIRAGETMVFFNLSLVEPRGRDSASVTLTASAPGWSSGVATIRLKKSDTDPS